MSSLARPVQLAFVLDERKQCSKCHTLLLITDFYVKRPAKGQRHSWCKECHHAMTNARAKERRQADPDDVRASQRAYYAANREHKRELNRENRLKNLEKMRERDRVYDATRREKRREYRERTREHRRAMWQAYKERNSEQIREKGHRDYRNNRSRYTAHTALRRARIREVGGAFTPAEWESLQAQHDHRCLCCGATNVPLSPDHVVPISRGGSNDIGNIQPLCAPCNLSKGAQTIDYR